MRPDREYLSDDADIEANRLRVSFGDNGDMYVTVLKPGERLGIGVRVTTSGTRRAQRETPLAVYDLWRAMGGEPIRDEHQRLVDACEELIAATLITTNIERTPGHAKIVERYGARGIRIRERLQEHGAWCPCKAVGLRRARGEEGTAT